MARSALLLGALAAPAAAGETRATAAALFQQGLAEMQAGHLETACAAIAESQRLDPTAGTLFTLAECHAKAGRSATAVAEYQDYLTLTSRSAAEVQRRHASRVELAKAAVAREQPRISRLTIHAANRLPAGALVLLDGTQLGSPALGLSLPMDPGPHLLLVRNAAGIERQWPLELQPGEAREVELTAPEPDRPGRPLRRATGKGTRDRGASGKPKASPGAAESRQHAARSTLPWIVGGVGLVSLSVGAVAGGLTLDAAATAKRDCSGSTCRTQAGVDAGERGNTLALVANVGVAVGVTALAVATYLWWRDGAQTPPQVALHSRAQPETGGVRLFPLLAADPNGAWLGVGGRL